MLALCGAAQGFHAPSMVRMSVVPRANVISAMKLDEAALTAVFHQVDTDKNGWLDKDELKAAYKLAGLPTDEDEINHAFNMIDHNSDGKISLDEFFNIAKQTESHDLIGIFGQIAARDAGHAFEFVDEPETHVSLRDKRLAEKDTRKFCLDRCLATGYCDALEDLLKMSTTQVKQFCDKCSHGDECELSYA